MKRSTLAVALVLVSASATASPRPHVDPLRKGFEAPPQSARPRAWWHWMNGNISAKGAKLDLAWMKRIGLGGVQLIEGDLGTPVIVPKRVGYLSPEWKAALAVSVATADRLGLEFAISSAPGWSATGGPWVKPVDAMKKLVWSETDVEGGATSIALPRPTATTGPYQDVPRAAIDAGAVGERQPEFYSDSVVLAFPAAPCASLAKPEIRFSEGRAAGGVLLDGRYATDIALHPDARGEAWVRYTYPSAVHIRSATIGLPTPVGFGAPTPPEARIEASDDGVRFRLVAQLPASASPVRAIAFPEVTARYFRLLLTVPTGAAGGPPTAPGVVAFLPPPAPSVFRLSELSLSGTERVDRAPEKAGFATVADYRTIDTGSPATKGVAPTSVLDLTTLLRPDGTLDWTAPAGRWRILRMGSSLIGHRNGPAPADATGLEVDKLSAPRVAAYLDTYFGLYRTAVGSTMFGRRGIRALLADSIEAGPQNWTDTMLADFTRLRGYDPRPWLPALTGEIVGDAAASDRFLFDFRRTISDLVAVHYETVAAKAHALGLVTYSEALEDHRPQLGDDLQMRSFADVPTGAMWQFAAGEQGRPTLIADAKGAASAAHLYGRPVAAAESFTAFGAPYAFSPRDLKAAADKEFSLGINRVLIHTSPHQPLTDGEAPGVALAPFLGQYFSRNETWAESAKPWIDYLSRSSFLLQQGRPHADILYFYGEDAPITALYGDSGSPSDIPAGYDYDYANLPVLQHRITVADGALVTPEGVRYALIALGEGSSRMSLATVRRLGALVAQGATLAGPRPLSDPGLADDPIAWRKAVDALWGSDRNVGRGHVYADLASALRDRAIAPDWSGATRDIAVLHRTIDDGQVYFVSNQSAESGMRELSFRVAGYVPELWHADTGKVEAAAFKPDGERTNVQVPLDAGDAVFVVFRRRLAIPVLPAAPEATIERLDGNWSLAFQSNRGGHAAPVVTELGSWTASSDDRIRYFSGAATYTRTLAITPEQLRPGQRRVLDLGDVRELADVAINGRAVATLWKPPFRLDVTDALHAGRNTIAVTVTNLWVNRLIGDGHHAGPSVTTTTGQTYRADAPLRPSGLLGPVTLRSAP